MSIYDKSSLVLIPSGTKTSKVYSQKPTNGDGDFDFTRSTAATRIAANGNIEKETQNLLLQSNSFNTSPWNLSSATMSGGQSGYDGSSDAWIFTTSVAGAANLQSFSSTGVLTYSVYAKAGSVNGIRLRIDTNSDADGFFNLVNGTIFQSSGIDASIEDVGGGWYRCSLAHNVAGPVKLQFFTTNGTTSYDNGSIYIQDAQLNQGLIAQEVITTTTTALYGGITDNVPRLDYTDSSCPALLLEPQRTNFVPNSEYLGSSDWDKNGFGTGVAPVLTFGEESPEGLNNAYEITFNTGAGTSSGEQSNISEAIGGQAAGDYTLSFWAKVSNGTDKIIARGAGGYLYTTCNLTTEWQRFEITENLATAGSVYVDIGLRRGLANEPLNSSVTCQIYGFQLEAGSYATSYIPTYGTSVTRNADVCNTLNVEDLIGQTEGTLFYQGLVEVFTGNDGHAIALTQDGDGNGSSRVLLYRANSTGNMKVYFQNASGVAFGQATLPIPTSSNDKYAIAYSTNDLAIYVNGVLEHTQSVGVIPTTKFVNINRWTGNIKHKNECKNVLLFKTRLSNEELATLTTI